MTLPRGLPYPMPVQTALWIRRPTDLMERCRREFGSVFTVRLPPSPIVFLSDPADIKTVFTAKPHQMHAGAVNRIIRVLVGDHSVLLLDEAEHMRQRKLLLPPFHGERMRFYGNTMAEITERTMATWPDGQAFSLHPYTQAITLEVILRTVFGLDEGARLSELRRQITKTLEHGESRLVTLVMLHLSEHPELEERLPWRYLLRRRDAMDVTLYRQIAERRKAGDPHRKDVLSTLLMARDDEGAGMTDAELRDELVTALAAGHETTATALAWAVERILSTPRVYDRLREEIRASGNGRTPDPERLARLPYLDATIKEVLRLRPVIPIVGRLLKEPFVFGGRELPEGTTVAPCIYLAHRDPDVYPDPEAFRPERFEGAQPDPYAYLPFGGGVRRCIGAAFASYEMKVVLGTILASCDLEAAQPLPAPVRRRAITFWPEHGTRVRVRRVRGARASS